MLEDVLNEVLPIAGFAVISSSIFIIIVLSKCKEIFRFLLYFAIIDLIQGLSIIYAGFYGVFISVYGEKIGKVMNPWNCYFRAFHNLLWSFIDVSQMLLLLLFAFDRFLRMIIPVHHKKISTFYLLWKVFVIFLILSMGATIPSLDYAILSSSNASISVSSLCRYSEVVGKEYYIQHILSFQIYPFLALFILFISLLIKGIRQTRPKWSYNWSEDRLDSKQLFNACFIRCILTSLSAHLPFMVLPKNLISFSNLSLDYILRLFYCVLVPTIQPLCYILFLPIFNTRIQMVFNRYGHNTKRDWISASDPPAAPGEKKDKFGEVNPFGSWYSSTGNVVGEAGVPMEEKMHMERSVSFFYEKEEREELEKQRKNQIVNSITVVIPPTIPSVSLDF